MSNFFKKHKLKISVVIYFLILISIPVSAYALKGSIFKKALNNTPQAPAPIVVFSTLEQTPTPIPIPIVEPSPTPSPTKTASKTTTKKTTQPAKTTKPSGSQVA